MRKHFVLCSIVLAVACSALGETSMKVGYVDIDRVTAKAKAVNNVMGSIKDQVTEIQEQIVEKQKKIRGLEEEVKRFEGIKSKDELAGKRKEIMQLKEELDDLDLKGRKKMREIDATVFDPILKKILFAIDDVAKEEKYDLVLRGEAVLHGSAAADITDKVIEKLNSKETTGTKTSSQSTTATAPPKPSTRSRSGSSATRPVDRQRD